MSSNVGLTTPRGSGTSGYVQRNLSLLKPRDPNYAVPPAAYGDNGPSDAGFKQRQPDKQILEHDRRRAIEVQIIEERDRLEEENEKIAEGNKKLASKNKTDSDDTEKSDSKSEARGRRVELTEEEIEERLDKLRERLTNELDDELAGKHKPGPSRDVRHRDQSGYEPYPSRQRRPNGHEEKSGYKGRKQFKTYQVHEQAEAKIQESERLRKALGIRGEGEETPWDSGRRGDRERGGRDRYADRDSGRRW
ncbi:pre-mRNA-splicing factor cwc21 [Nannizzia gypsea CBS 118893]|uniref:Pre-mRNA-splicing factor cwc21 n=1 Tax=Arthroderma gypseum (strain ATCC MYA-4604 / CBS 118893) TaxID=535722 RepID=E5QYU2_ARTGP|nr:pre-mRNA-splicing factor cwc21 [Nannizzia gypsea CBS 118893]EFQ97280.1 pre-mRNA-splicing factor cwc21 [Nannizzia gypsea CBS 118893]